MGTHRVQGEKHTLPQGVTVQVLCVLEQKWFSLEFFPLPKMEENPSLSPGSMGSSMQDTAAEERGRQREIWTFLVSTQWDWT